MTYPQQQWGNPPQQQWGTPPPPFGQQSQGGYSGPGAPPPPPSGNGIKLSEHIGSLVWAKVNRYEPEYTGQYGTREALFLDLEVIQGRPDAMGQVYRDGLYTNGLLVGQLRNAVGTEVFARVAAKPGANANPAIYFDSPRPGDEQLVNAYLARKGQGAVGPQSSQGALAQQGGGGQAPNYGQPTSQPFGQGQQYGGQGQQQDQQRQGPALYQSFGQGPQPQGQQQGQQQGGGMPPSAPPPMPSYDAPPF